jgi:predicted nucleic-acid-binding protein
VIGVDTNVLARFYVEDPTDVESAPQREAARRVFDDPEGLFVPVTVLLEFEWVLRAFYDFGRSDFTRVLAHLAGLPQVVIEDRSRVLLAVDLHEQGLDFADALHVARSEHCSSFATFDDRKFARRATRLGVPVPVRVPR